MEKFTEKQRAMIEKVKIYAKKHKKMPEHDDFRRENGLFSYPTLWRHFGGVDNLHRIMSELKDLDVQDKRPKENTVSRVKECVPEGKWIIRRIKKAPDKNGYITDRF